MAWADLEEEIVEVLEREAYRRAVDGDEAPVVSAGRVVAHERRYSDALLMMLLVLFS